MRVPWTARTSNQSIVKGETVETVSEFILGGSKITADGDCSHEIERHLLLGRKVMTNLDSILKSIQPHSFVTMKMLSGTLRVKGSLLLEHRYFSLAIKEYDVDV